ncbi:hypothetical protein ACFO1B_30335 [Dactylosporangium siamense]|uniref:Uncharacterized protein n=1 Tax=Dactylosporangium siamense TaxID=685454 RepID=A0A919PNX5_9ACTN|nr:hypothetical protein [Dactylosporangium siamense]GIG48225.1 hypothetical protein Dsi01nite_062660 [Dactylosporangium siamense]
MQTLKRRLAPAKRRPASAGLAGKRRSRKRLARPKISGRRILVAVVAVFLLFSVGRSVLPALGIETPGLPSFGGGGDTPTDAPTTKAPKAPTVDLNGVMVPGGGEPMITLNPGLVRLGGTVTVNGSGFDQGSVVEVYLGPSATAAQPSGKSKPSKAAAGKPVMVGTAKAGKYGIFTLNFPFPTKMTTPVLEVTAQARGSDKVAKADAAVAQGAGQAALSAVVGKPGDVINLTVKGFSPGEELQVFWGRINGDPALTLKADEDGSVGKTPIKVGVTAVGTTSLVVVGKTSGAAASAPFQVLRLYPSIKLAPYAVKATQSITFSGAGFAPGERVLVRLNAAGGQPVMAVTTDGAGGFKGAGLTMPYQLKGAQSLVFIGEQSRAATSTGFTILPYTPQARTNAYGGLPGTVVNFYATQFAPNEAVHVYAKTSKGAKGDLVSAFRVDKKGTARAVGQYTIPGNTENSVIFELRGQLSGSTATVNFKVDSSGGPVDIPTPKPYVLPKDLEK